MHSNPRDLHMRNAAALAVATEAVAIGAFAVGALVVGHLFIRRLAVDDAVFKTLEIQKLIVKENA